nr:hypothetical protein XPJYXGBL_XPJYXGBL_CDS_0009 [Microvirus sp.]
MHDAVRLINSMGKVTESSGVTLLKHRSHKAGLSVLDRIKSEFHNLIPPRKILGSILIFLLWAAVRRKILLSNFGFVFLRILQLPFKRFYASRKNSFFNCQTVRLNKGRLQGLVMGINQRCMLTLCLYLFHLLRIVNIKKPVIITRRAEFKLTFIGRKIDILILIQIRMIGIILICNTRLARHANKLRFDVKALIYLSTLTKSFLHDVTGSICAGIPSYGTDHNIAETPTLSKRITNEIIIVLGATFVGSQIVESESKNNCVIMRAISSSAILTASEEPNTLIRMLLS